MVDTVSPGLKSLVGLKVSVLPLWVVVPRAPFCICPPRWWLNTFTAPSVPPPVLIVCEKVTATLLPAAALRWLRVGLRDVMVIGAAVTVNVPPVAVPPAVTTLTAPVVLPAPTVKARLVAVLVPRVAAVPFTVTAVAPVRLVPVIVTCVPAGPLVGVKLVMVGAGGSCSKWRSAPSLPPTSISSSPSPSRSVMAGAV